jgi:hypothetical protein
MAQKAFPIRRARTIIPGQSTSPGSAGVLISCSADGWVRLTLTSNDFIDVYAQAGTSAIPDIHVTGVATSSAFTPLATNVVVNVCDY